MLFVVGEAPRKTDTDPLRVGLRHSFTAASKIRHMGTVYLCDAVRTPFGRYGGALATVRTDDLAAVPIRAFLDRHPGMDPREIDDVVYGCANQAGEDNRNVGRMALLLAGVPQDVPGSTVNR